MSDTLGSDGMTDAERAELLASFQRGVGAKPPTLAEFLLARIAEDEGIARMRLQNGEPKRAPVPWGCPSAARVLAECEAKRRIVGHALREGGYTGNERWVLLCLALPYADHPDCREEWRS